MRKEAESETETQRCLPVAARSNVEPNYCYWLFHVLSLLQFFRLCALARQVWYTVAIYR